MSLFRSLGEVTETIIFTGSSILVFCLVSENFENPVAFLVFLGIKRRLNITMSKQVDVSNR